MIVERKDNDEEIHSNKKTIIDRLTIVNESLLIDYQWDCRIVQKNSIDHWRADRLEEMNERKKLMDKNLTCSDKFTARTWWTIRKLISKIPF